MENIRDTDEKELGKLLDELIVRTMTMELHLQEILESLRCGTGRDSEPDCFWSDNEEEPE